MVHSSENGSSHFLPGGNLHCSLLTTRNTLSLACIIDSSPLTVLANQSLQIEVWMRFWAFNTCDSIEIRIGTWTISYPWLVIKIRVVNVCPLVQRFAVQNQAWRGHWICLVVYVSDCCAFVNIEIEDSPRRAFLAFESIVGEMTGFLAEYAFSVNRKGSFLWTFFIRHLWFL